MTEGSLSTFQWWNGWVLDAYSCRGLWRKGSFSHASNTDNNTSPTFIAGRTSGPLLFDDVNTPFANCICLFKDITEFPKAQLLPLRLQTMRSEFVFGNAVFNFHLKITPQPSVAPPPAIQCSQGIFVTFNTRDVCNICPGNFESMEAI